MTEPQEETRRHTDGLKPMFRRDRPSWMAIAAMMLSVTAPCCGWMISLGSRVAVLEEKTGTLATAAQMAEVKQKIDDWIQESEREHKHIDDRVRKLGD